MKGELVTGTLRLGNSAKSRNPLAFFSGRPINFSLIDDLVCASARPFSEWQILWLHKQGVKAILSLTMDSLREDWLVDLEYCHVPIEDHAIPTTDQVERSVNFLMSNVEKNQRVLVHCTAGKGRTGTVLAAYMCRKYGLSPSDAIEALRSKRPGSVELAQRKAVEAYFETLQGKWL
jgi:atypical dual specificity phosphatase